MFEVVILISSKLKAPERCFLLVLVFCLDVKLTVWDDVKFLQWFGGVISVYRLPFSQPNPDNCKLRPEWSVVGWLWPSKT